MNIQKLDNLYTEAAFILNNTAPIIQADRDGNIIAFNPAAREIFGKDLSGESIFILIPGLDKSILSDFNSERLAQHQMTLNDQILLFTITKDEKTDLLYFYGTDITEAVEIKKDNRNKDKLLNAAINSLSHSLYIINANDYKIEIANKKTGVWDSIKNKTCHTVTHNSLTPCGGDNHACPLEMIKKTGKPVTVEHIHRRSDGSSGIFEVHGYPICNKKGEVTHIIEYSMDITDRKQAEEKLRKSEEFERALSSALPDSIFVLDTNGVIQKANRTKSGQFNEDIIGQKAITLIPRKFHSIFEKTFQQALATGKLQTLETDVNLPDGRHYFLNRLSLVSLVGADRSIILISTEITEQKWAEEQMSVFRRFAEESDHGVKLSDINRNVIYINPALCRMIGLKRPDDTYGKSVAQFYDDQTWQRITSEILPKLIAEGKWIGELDLLNKNGFVIQTLNNLFVLHDSDGNPLYFANLITDISKSKKKEKILRENEEKFRTLYNSSGDAIMLLADGKFIDCNKATLEIFGYSTIEEFCKMHPADLSPPTQPCGTDSMTLANNQIMLALKHGTNQFEWVHKRTDGFAFHAEVLLTAICLDDRKIILASVRDITERKHIEDDQRRLTELIINSNDKLEDALAERELAEKTLSETINRYTAMINTVPALMFIKDNEDRYIEVNEAFCKFAGKSKDQIIGKQVREVHTKNLAEKYYIADKFVMENDKEMINQEEQYINEDGNINWISSSRIPLHDDNGKVTGLVGLAQDITKQHTIQDKLTQSDKLAAIGQLAAGVAHEINNPVGYINSNLNTMSKYLKKINDFVEGKNEQSPEDMDDLKEMLQDFADAINESMEGTNRVKQIVSDLKSFSRVDRAEKEFANINEGINSTLNVVWNEIKYKAQVKKEFGDIPELFCMPNQLNQVFMNLLVNAAHSIEKEMGLITIKTWANDKNIYISIADDGAGIPKENMKKLFEPFFTTKEVGKGTGLGLSLSYDIVKRHKGHIEVKSEVGVGTEFIITFPQEGIDEREAETAVGR